MYALELILLKSCAGTTVGSFFLLGNKALQRGLSSEGGAIAWKAPRGSDCLLIENSGFERRFFLQLAMKGWLFSMRRVIPPMQVAIVCGDYVVGDAERVLHT